MFNTVPLSNISKDIRYGLTASAQSEGSHRFIRITDITDNGILKSEAAKFITPDTLSAKKFALNIGDLLIARSGSVGRACLITEEHQAVFASYLIRFRLNAEKADSHFVFYFTLSPQYRNFIELQSRGAAIKNINANQLGSIPVPLPHIHEQRRIVARIKECMERVEEIDGLRTEAIEEANVLVQSILFEVWETPEIKNADREALSNLGEIITGNTPSRKRPEFFGGHQPWVTPGDFNGRIISTGREFLTEKGLKEGRARVVPEGSVLVVCIGATIGKIAIADRNLGINQQINAVTFDNTKLHSEYGYWACRFLVPEIISNASKNTLPILNKSRFSQLKIPVPEKKVQKMVAARLDSVEAVASEIIEEMAHVKKVSKSLRESILRKAFAGEL